MDLYGPEDLQRAVREIRRDFQAVALSARGTWRNFVFGLLCALPCLDFRSRYRALRRWRKPCPPHAQARTGTCSQDTLHMGTHVWRGNSGITLARRCRCYAPGYVLYQGTTMSFLFAECKFFQAA